MALVVFLRGVNVGGHRTFRPAALAAELKAYDVLNVGAAGTFVVRKPRARAAFLAELRRRLPFETLIVACDAHDLLRLVASDPFAGQRLRPHQVRFVTVLEKMPRSQPALPAGIPANREWYVRVLALHGASPSASTAGT